MLETKGSLSEESIEEMMVALDDLKSLSITPKSLIISPEFCKIGVELGYILPTGDGLIFNFEDCPNWVDDKGWIHRTEGEIDPRGIF